MALGNNNELLKSVAVEWRKRDCGWPNSVCQLGHILWLSLGLRDMNLESFMVDLLTEREESHCHRNDTK